MDENKAPDWGLSIKSKKKVRGGAAMEVTLEVEYSTLLGWIEKLTSIPFVAGIPAIQTIVGVLKSVVRDDKETGEDCGPVTSEWNDKGGIERPKAG